MLAPAHRDLQVAPPDRRPDAWGIDPGILARLDDARLLSLDIFDTLLLRAVAHPHEVFLEVGRRALERGWLPRHCAPEHVRALRVNAEQRARAAKNPAGPAEVTLSDIWTAMPFGSGARLVDLEIEVEADTCFRNPGIWMLVQRARARGIPVVLLSDMYLSREGLTRILARNGCGLEHFDALFLSSEGGGAKWNGALFDRLAERYPHIARGEMLHVGDNARSDVEQARRAGLDACHYRWTSPRADAVERLERMRHGSAASALHGVRRLACACAEERTDDLTWWFELGATVMGPFLAAFADWVVAECRADGITAIRPLMREGALFSHLLTASARAQQVDLDIEPLYVSRAASWFPGLDAVDARAIDELCARPHLTVREALTLVGIDDLPGELAAHAAVVPGAQGDPHAATAESALRAYLSRDDVRSLLEARRAIARARLVAFLSQSVGAAQRIAVVDLGFHGSVGFALERATRGHIQATWHQFLALGAESIEHAWFAGADVRAFAGGPGRQAELVPALIRHAAVLETLLVSGATTIGYADAADGRVVALTEAQRTTAHQSAMMAACQRGVLAFQRVWLAARADNPTPLDTAARDRQRLCEAVHRLVDLPSSDEARRLGALVHEHNGGSAGCEPLVDVRRLPDHADAERFLEESRTYGRSYGQTWLWPQGLVALRWPGRLTSPWEDVRSEDGRVPALVRLARRARRSGVRTCLVYGAGDAGRSLAAALRDEGVMVRAFVDRNDRLWESVVDGLSVLGPQSALAGDCHTYVVGSLAFATQIQADLRARYAHRSSDLRIIAVIDSQEAPRAA